MGDSYWNRQQPVNPSVAGMLKRPRSDYGCNYVTKNANTLANYLLYTEYIQGSLDWIDDIYEIWGPLWEGMGVGGKLLRNFNSVFARSRLGNLNDIGCLPPSGVPSAHEMHYSLARDDDRGAPWAAKDTKAIGSAYDHYLQNAQPTSFSSGEASNLSGIGLGRSAVAGMHGRSLTDPAAMGHSGTVGRDLAPNGRGMGFDDRFTVDARAPNGRDLGFDGRLPVDAMPRPGRDTLPLPPDASNTLYVEGLPSDCRKREVAHIFRPFVGYKEVRLVSKESRHRGGDPLVLCFVDFVSPACAATALSALQGDHFSFLYGYNMDEHDPKSSCLRLQFSKYPGPRSGERSRGKSHGHMLTTKSLGMHKRSRGGRVMEVDFIISLMHSEG
ncbi:hypothetical protein TEA_022276 [Camellia sinensis var. sinensis]|uniref:RRM domain-containing protein n=1 Tax=Camellia sinensis var. sinensis TaxID=542762 RepID=A0A4S4EP39_CAMSN|nr:hypothetical protein TEA_022276 [Camellia sinensis var. sinensis]